MSSLSLAFEEAHQEEEERRRCQQQENDPMSSNIPHSPRPALVPASAKPGSNSPSNKSSPSSASPSAAVCANEAAPMTPEVSPAQPPQPQTPPEPEAQTEAEAEPQSHAEPAPAAADEPATPEETEDERMAREMQESEELCRMLMAEEAAASYAMQVQMLDRVDDSLPDEEQFAIRQLLRADEEEEQARQRQEEDGSLLDEAEEEDEGEDYEELLELGQHIGDVKAERWALKAPEVIASMPVVVHGAGAEACYDSMCIFCQTDYEDGERVRILPCKHAFHADCVDVWLAEQDTCPICKKCVCEDEETEEEAAPQEQETGTATSSTSA